MKYKINSIKTLLPIYSVTLIGAGAISAIVLTSCVDKDNIETLYTRDEVLAYVQNHAQNCPVAEFGVTVETGPSYSINDAQNYLQFMIQHYKKQSLINVFLYIRYYFNDNDFDKIEVTKNSVKGFYKDTEELNPIEDAVLFDVSKFKSIVDCVQTYSTYVADKETEKTSIYCHPEEPVALTVNGPTIRINNE
jgi:hypothetical protein